MKCKIPFPLSNPSCMRLLKGSFVRLLKPSLLLYQCQTMEHFNWCHSSTLFFFSFEDICFFPWRYLFFHNGYHTLSHFYPCCWKSMLVGFQLKIVFVYPSYFFSCESWVEHDRSVTDEIGVESYLQGLVRGFCFDWQSSEPMTTFRNVILMNIPVMQGRVLSLFSPVRLFAALWTIACQPPLYVGFCRQEYWSGLPCPPPDRTSVSYVSCLGKWLLHH